MEGIYHYTGIRLFEPYSEFRFDETLNDKVWTKMFFWLHTRDISLGSDQMVTTRHEVILPPPNPETFVPFDQVDERVALRWIHLNVPDLIERQNRNTELLEYRIAHGERHPEDFNLGVLQA